MNSYEHVKRMKIKIKIKIKTNVRYQKHFILFSFSFYVSSTPRLQIQKILETSLILYHFGFFSALEASIKSN